MTVFDDMKIYGTEMTDVPKGGEETNRLRLKKFWIKLRRPSDETKEWRVKNP